MSASNGKHTPGPWVAQGRDGLEVMGPTYRVVTVALDDPPKTSPLAYRTAQADAKLIAAAPEMADALSLAVLQWEAFAKQAGALDGYHAKKIAQARAALKKAGVL